jgi:hypothetical protein
VLIIIFFNVFEKYTDARGYSQFGFNVDLSFHKGKSGTWQVFDVALGYDSLINFYQRMVRYF